MAIGDKIYIADKPTLDEVKSNIGATADTGGTTAAGGIFAKLNAILQQFFSNWTAVRAAKLDGIGSADDTGGTGSTGTIMGKLNTLLDSAGTPVYIPSDTPREILLDSEIISQTIEAHSGSGQYCYCYSISPFVARRSGTIKLKAKVKAEKLDTIADANLVLAICCYPSRFSYYGDNKYGMKSITPKSPKTYGKPIGTVVQTEDSITSYYSLESKGIANIASRVIASSQAYTELSALFHVLEGDTLEFVFVAMGEGTFGSSGKTSKWKGSCNYVQLFYDEG